MIWRFRATFQSSVPLAKIDRIRTKGIAEALRVYQPVLSIAGTDLTINLTITMHDHFGATSIAIEGAHLCRNALFDHHFFDMNLISVEAVKAD